MVAFQKIYPTIPAHDLDRARAFYEGALGCVPVQIIEAGVFYQTPGGRGEFFLYPSRWAGTAGHTLVSFDVADIYDAVDELRERGVVFEEYDFPDLKTVGGIAELGGEYAAWFKDTEGNIIAVGQRA